MKCWNRSIRTNARLPLIEHKAFTDKLSQCVRGPDPEARRVGAVHPVANGDVRVEVIVDDIARNRTISFGSNYPNISDSCFFLKLAARVFAHVVTLFQETKNQSQA